MLYADYNRLGLKLSYRMPFQVWCRVTQNNAEEWALMDYAGII